MKRIYFLSLVIMIIALVNCKKDSTLTKKEMLTGKNWILSACTVSPAMSFNGTTSTDWFGHLDACIGDNILMFNTNGTFTTDEGAIKCNSADPQVEDSGTWTFNADETVISMTHSASAATTMTIISLSSSKMQVSWATTGTTAYTFTATYVIK